MPAEKSKSFELADLVSTEEFAKRLADSITTPFTITLNGTLGAGKTQFVRFFAAAMGVPIEDVTSPTYVLIQRYVGRQTIYHFDFYRLETAEQVWDLGIDEIFVEPAVVLIEWANKFPDCLPEDYLQLDLSTRAEERNNERRTLRVSANGNRSYAILRQLSD
ncbi:MAG: tRNA (adenosine(37)-N6)-threonylcarbamoyltransferase complex ATPase subunit type 1 TsaE [Aureliella sp.]